MEPYGENGVVEEKSRGCMARVEGCHALTNRRIRVPSATDSVVKVLSETITAVKHVAFFTVDLESGFAAFPADMV